MAKILGLDTLEDVCQAHPIGMIKCHAKLLSWQHLPDPAVSGFGALSGPTHLCWGHLELVHANPACS